MAKIIVLDVNTTKDNAGIRTIDVSEVIGVRLTIHGFSSYYNVEFYRHGSYSGERIEVTWNWPGNSFSAKEYFQRQQYWGFFDFKDLLERLLKKAIEQGLDRPELIASWAQRARGS